MKQWICPDCHKIYPDSDYIAETMRWHCPRDMALLCEWGLWEMQQIRAGLDRQRALAQPRLADYVPST